MGDPCIYEDIVLKSWESFLWNQTKSNIVMKLLSPKQNLIIQLLESILNSPWNNKKYNIDLKKEGKKFHKSTLKKSDLCKIVYFKMIRKFPKCINFCNANQNVIFWDIFFFENWMLFGWHLRCCCFYLFSGHFLKFSPYWKLCNDLDSKIWFFLCRKE